jgi:CTP synthase
VCRSEQPITDDLKRKISNLCDVDVEAVVNAADASSIYFIPLVLHEEGLDAVVCRYLRLETEPPDLADWADLVARIEAADRPVRVAIVGKYVSLPDAYLSVVEALNHAAFHFGAKLETVWVQAEEITGMLAAGRLADVDGIVIPGGFGQRGMEGKIAAAGFARDNGIPCLGLCLGLQAMTIEYGRNVLGLENANSSEIDPATPHAVIDLMDSQRGVTDMGGTMRLGNWIAELRPGTQVFDAYGTGVVKERHRHRYEFNNTYRDRYTQSGFKFSGLSKDDLVEIIELPGHPWFVATQFHPEFTSTPRDGHPLFAGFVKAARAHRTAQLPEAASA